MDGLVGILTILFVFLIFILVLAAAYYVTRFVAKSHAARGSAYGGNIKILDKTVLGQDRSLLVVSVAGKAMLLGVTNQHVTHLSDLDENNLVSLPEGQDTDFASILKNTIQNGFGLKKGDGHDKRKS